MRDIEATSNLRYLGRKTQEEVNEMLAESHIFVSPSEFEGFANTFIQAWMREVPLLSLHVNPDDVLDYEKIGRHSGNYETRVVNVRQLITDMEEEAMQYAFENHSIANGGKWVRLLES